MLNLFNERRFEHIKYFALSIPDLSGGRMRETLKFINSFSAGKTANPPRFNVGPPYQDGKPTLLSK
jgi:hypothetical protein